MTQTLPNKELLLVTEVADYFRVTSRTIYLWIENGHLEVIRTPGKSYRITRKSIETCRFAPPEE